MENYLIHHGIKGQRWGVRRYQNEDGSYTAAGRKRYIKDTNKRLDKLSYNTFQANVDKQHTAMYRDILDSKYRKALQNGKYRKAQKFLKRRDIYNKKISELDATISKNNAEIERVLGKAFDMGLEAVVLTKVAESIAGDRMYVGKTNTFRVREKQGGQTNTGYSKRDSRSSSTKTEDPFKQMSRDLADVSEDDYEDAVLQWMNDHLELFD